MQIQRVVEKEVVEVEKIVEKEKVVEKVVVQEKIVNVLNAEGEALTEYNAALVNQRAQLGDQLEASACEAAERRERRDVEGHLRTRRCEVHVDGQTGRVALLAETQ